MSVLVNRVGTYCLYIKGAPESVLERCTTVLVNGRAIALTDAMHHTSANCNLRSTWIAYTRKGFRQGVRQGYQPLQTRQLRGLHPLRAEPHFRVFGRYARPSVPRSQGRYQEVQGCWNPRYLYHW